MFPTTKNDRSRQPQRPAPSILRRATATLVLSLPTAAHREYPLRTSGDRLDLSKLERVTKIGVSFEELDLLHFAPMRASVPQDVEAVADVYHID